jgi:exodeoxyribonuclease VII large subunit
MGKTQVYFILATIKLVAFYSHTKIMIVGIRYNKMDNILIPEYRVEELVKSIKTVLEGSFSYLKIVGEIGDFKKSSSGHYYFNLKENDVLINTVLFKNNLLNTNLVLQDGLEVICYGKLTTYMAKSNYQIIVESIRINGEGKLKKIIEDRKQKLKKEGLFDKKRKITKNIKNVGIITAENGAAIKDIEIRLRERMPLESVILYPSLMQGMEAERSIMDGIKFFNKNYPKLDVIVVTRGGGSTEDLMCFNGEELARTVFISKIPIVSAVGHEIDWTIIDLVADLRLPTPTAVGEFLSPLKSECRSRLEIIFIKILKNVIIYYKNRWKHVEYIIFSIFNTLSDVFYKKINRFKIAVVRLRGFNKNKIFKQGYVLLEKNGKIINYKHKFQPGEELDICMYKGKRVKVVVKE